MNRLQSAQPSLLFEPWMIQDKNDGAGVEDFRARTSVAIVEAQ